MEVYRQKNRLLKPWYLVAYLPLLIILFAHFRQHPEELDLFSLGFWALVIAILLPLCLLLLMQLEIETTATEIRYRYFPIHWAFRSVKWETIQSARLVTFDPVRNFLGYGYRISKKYGKGLITKGNKGLLIEMPDGSRITLEITDLPGFEAFLKRQKLQFVNLNSVKMEETV